MRASRRLRVFLLAGADAGLVLLAGTAAAWIRFNQAMFVEMLHELASHPGFILWVVGSLWALATTFDLYRPEAWRTRDELLLRLAALAFTFPVLIALGVYAVPGWRFGRGLLALTVLFTEVGVGILRGTVLLPISRSKAPSALVIGSNPIVESLRAELETHPFPPFRIGKHLPELQPEDEAAPRVIDTDGIELIVVAQSADEGTFDRLATLNFSGTTVVDAATAYASLTGRIPIRHVDARWFIATGDFSNIAGTPFHRIQRVLDLIGALLLMVLTSPVLLLAAALVLVVGGRPVVYRQTRLGRFRKPFVLYKLRTMRVDAEPNGPMFAEKNDRRLLPFGRFLRRWRIDELPQLWNVLKGEMSLVGPRPERPEIAARLESTIPFYGFRYSVRPGITGWAQVNLPYCAATNDHMEKLEYDLYSLRHHGLMLYGLVILRSLGALVFRPGR